MFKPQPDDTPETRIDLDARAHAAPADPISDEEAMALLGRMRAAFADQPEDEIARETAEALAEVRA